MRDGMEIPDSEPPDAAVVMLNTRLLNEWAHTSYSFEQVAEMSPMMFDILASLQRGLRPATK